VTDKDGAPLEAPEITIPDEFIKLWQVFFDVAASVGKVSDGVCRPTPPSEWLAWKQLTEADFTGVEFALLRKMDSAFCSAMNAEIEERRQRESSKK